MMTDNDLRALYVLAADWHSGFGSRGYRFMCRVARLIERRNLVLGCGCDIGEHWDGVRRLAEYAKWQPMAQRSF